MANKVKNKTHKGLSKVVRKRKGGTYKFQPANKNHKLTHKSNASRRRRHQTSEMHNTDIKRVKDILK